MRDPRLPRPATSLAHLLSSWTFALVCLLLASACHRSPRSHIVLYCAQDQSLAEPILRQFESQTGMEVRAVYDSEATKTVGLANRLISESPHPVADVYWGNEEFRARHLLSLGVFETTHGITTFGRRSRRWVVRDGPLPPGIESIHSLVELTNARLRGKVSLAHPRFGTTSTHFHLLRQHWGENAWREWCRAMAENQPFIEEGNSQVVQRVARGEAWLGLTDSDDIVAGQREGLKVRALHDFPETFSIPNTLARVRGSPNPSGALRLIEFLSSPAVENQLISSGGLEPHTPENPRPGLVPDWNRLISTLESTSRQLEELFHR